MYRVKPKFLKSAGWCLAILLLLASGCAGAVKNIAPQSSALNSAAISPKVKQNLKNGDWLVIRGLGKADNLIATATNMPLSHAAIYDAEFDRVIEADAAGVHVAPLADFVAKAQRVIVIRPVWSTPENSVIAVNQARSWLGAGYNFTGLIGLDTPKRYYCTQVALFAYKPVMDKKPNPIPKVIAPGQMYHFGKIIYDSGP